MDSKQKKELFKNIVASMEGVEERFIKRALKLFEQISPEYAKGVKDALDGKI